MPKYLSIKEQTCNKRLNVTNSTINEFNFLNESLHN